MSNFLYSAGCQEVLGGEKEAKSQQWAKRQAVLLEALRSSFDHIHLMML